MARGKFDQFLTSWCEKHGIELGAQATMEISNALTRAAAQSQMDSARLNFLVSEYKRSPQNFNWVTSQPTGDPDEFIGILDQWVESDHHRL